MLDHKEIKFLKVGKFGAGFRLSKKWFTTVKKCKFKKRSFIMTS